MSACQDDQRGRLDRIEQIELDIAHHRRHYMAETWLGHEGVALWHEAQVDELVQQRARLMHEPRPRPKHARPSHL